MGGHGGKHCSRSARRDPTTPWTARRPASRSRVVWGGMRAQAQGAPAAEADRQRMEGQPQGVHHGCAARPPRFLGDRLPIAQLRCSVPKWCCSVCSLLDLHVLSSCAPAELIRSKGDQTMTVEQLTAEIIPRGRGVPSVSSPAIGPHGPLLGRRTHSGALPPTPPCHPRFGRSPRARMTRAHASQGRCRTRSSLSCWHKLTLSLKT